MARDSSEAATEEAPKAVLDAGPIARLREMSQGLGPEVPRRIVELFLGDSPARLATLKNGLANGDVEAVGYAAHALKGSSANLGAKALAELCHQLEELPADVMSTRAEEQLAALEVEYGKVELAMRDLLAEFS